MTPATERGIFECSHSGFYISFDVEKMCKNFLIVLRINIHVMDPKCEHTCKKVGIFFGAGNQWKEISLIELEVQIVEFN